MRVCTCVCVWFSLCLRTHNDREHETERKKKGNQKTQRKNRKEGEKKRENWEGRKRCDHNKTTTEICKSWPYAAALKDFLTRLPVQRCWSEDLFPINFFVSSNRTTPKKSPRLSYCRSSFIAYCTVVNRMSGPAKDNLQAYKKTILFSVQTGSSLRDRTLVHGAFKNHHQMAA